MPCELEVFRGLRFGASERSPSEDVSRWKDGGADTGAYWSKHPGVATLFAARPKNEILHNERVFQRMMRADKQDIEVFGDDTTWFNEIIWRAAWSEMDRLLGDETAFGLVLRGTIDGSSKVRAEKIQWLNYDHLLEMEIMVHSPVPVTHIGTVTPLEAESRWMSIDDIPAEEFTVANRLYGYIMDHGSQMAWQSNRVPKLVMYAVQEGPEHGREALAFTEMFENDLWTVWCELIPKYDRR